MPRRVATQVVQTVSRLLESGLIKQPPVWYEAVINHPPMPVPPRQQVVRPDEDLPRALRSGGKRTNAWLQRKAETAPFGRDNMNSKKKTKSLAPSLKPKPIVYDEDSIRKQFFRDHPWEAYRPTTLVEQGDQLASEPRAYGDPRRLRSYGRNPGVEDFVACTLAAHRLGKLSLSQAYHNTLSSYHGLKAEREHATRYAILEANYYGADLGKTEIQRGFEKEEKALDTWAVWAAGMVDAPIAGGATAGSTSGSVNRSSKNRVKRTDDSFTLGQSYLEAAKAFQTGQVTADRLAEGRPSETSTTTIAPSNPSISLTPTRDPLGLANHTLGQPQSNNRARARTSSADV